VGILNRNPDPEIRKEGNIMSVIIKRCQKIPVNNIQTYKTVEYYQTRANIIIYEGEKKIY
jgi:molecular chaperone DnaK (HSP70)